MKTTRVLPSAAPRVRSPYVHNLDYAGENIFLAFAGRHIEVGIAGYKEYFLLCTSYFIGSILSAAKEKTKTFILRSPQDLYTLVN